MSRVIRAVAAVVLLGAVVEAGPWRLEERSRIEALVYQYCTSVDRLDWDLYQSVFTEGAVIDYTAAGGAVGTAPEMVAWLKVVFQDSPIRLARHQHLVSNIEITFNDAGAEAGKPLGATVRAAFTAPMSLNVFPLEYGPLMTCAGWYHHELVQNSAGEWQSVSLREEIAYNQATVHSILLILGVMYAIRCAGTFIARTIRGGKVKAA